MTPFVNFSSPSPYSSQSPYRPVATPTAAVTALTAGASAAAPIIQSITSSECVPRSPKPPMPACAGSAIQRYSVSK
ncbi:MAG: hypothetical protein BWY52_00738 [Chloroflexi bacterium ADurb.Bin325]|nr:MAG: hypothetical protein BWY52_00738 [Chloroflexi bacterium ADurb.Bin325]